MAKVRWGILGAARVNERMLPAIANAANGELIAIGSRRPEAAKECLAKFAPQLEDKVPAHHYMMQLRRVGSSKHQHMLLAFTSG